MSASCLHLCSKRKYRHQDSLYSLVALLRHGLNLTSHFRGKDPFTTVLTYRGRHLLDDHEVLPNTEIQGDFAFDYVMVTHQTLHGLLLRLRVVKSIAPGERRAKNASVLPIRFTGLSGL